MKRWLLALVCLSACSGKSSPLSPTAPVIPPTPQITLTGHVTATNGGQPLAGLSVDLSGQSTQTDTSGAFSYAMLPGASTRLSLTGSGIVPRSLMVAVGSSRDVNVDAIGVAGFDLNFYRQFVRNGFDAPAGSEPLRRWTRNPMVYLKTVDEGGAAISPALLDSVSATLMNAASQWTNGRFTIASIERGAGTKEGVSGYITVKWLDTVPADNACGRAQVGQDGGYIELDYRSRSTNCQCGNLAIRPRTVRHELGHAFGFWHTDSTGDVMSGKATSGCDAVMSPRELAAAAIAYSRPVGNADPDSDPSSTVLSLPMRIAQ